MLILKVIDKSGETKGEWRGSDIVAEYRGELTAGDRIKVLLDGTDFLAVKLDATLAESIVWAPKRYFEYVIPTAAQLTKGYNPPAFAGEEHVIRVREPEDEEIYGYRNLALNSHDKHEKVKYFPHATANFVTREDPSFYERNAIDGEKNNQGHGDYPYHSWSGGAREDIEFRLDFGRDVEIDKLVFYLRADTRRTQDFLTIPIGKIST